MPILNTGVSSTVIPSHISSPLGELQQQLPIPSSIIDNAIEIAAPMNQALASSNQRSLISQLIPASDELYLLTVLTASCFIFSLSIGVIMGKLTCQDNFLRNFASYTDSCSGFNHSAFIKVTTISFGSLVGLTLAVLGVMRAKNLYNKHMLRSLDHLWLPKRISTKQCNRGKAYLSHGINTPFEQVAMAYNPEIRCPMTLKHLITSEALELMERGDLLDFDDYIENPVVVGASSVPIVYERDDLISAWIDKGEDPTSRQSFKLNQLRTPIFTYPT